MQLLANTLALASIYILLAVGYVVVYRASRVLNLAHGELMMLAGYAFFGLVSATPGDPLFSAVLVTVSLGILLRGLVLLGWTADILYPLAVSGYKNVPWPLPGGAVLTTIDLLSILMAVTVLLALWGFFARSRLGIQMRAAAENPLLAAQRPPAEAR